MKLAIHSLFIAVLAMMTNSAVSEESSTTDWLEMSPGSQGQLIDAKVLDIEKTNEITVIDIQLPKSALEDLEHVEVQARDKSFLKQPRKAVPLVDENGSPYGIRIYLKKAPNFDFRIRLFDENVMEKE